MDEPLWIRQGESETYRMVCREGGGREADLSGATSVIIRMRPKADEAGAWTEYTATRESGGAVSFALTGFQTSALPLGGYYLQARANFADGFRTFPKPGYAEARVVTG